MQPQRLLTASLRTHPYGEQLAAIMAAALAAVDPWAAVERHLRFVNSTLWIGNQAYRLQRNTKIVVVGAGKAGAPMAQAAYQILGDRITNGLVIVKAGHLGTAASQLGPIRLAEASHPVPDARGIAATAQLAALLHDLTPIDLVLVMISGGGSALLTAPAPGLTLADLQALTNVLLRSGAPIGAINTLRKHCSRLTGGQLARLAAPARCAALIISDVVGSPLDVIASGPTVPDPTTFEDAWTIIERYHLHDCLPPAIIAHIEQGRTGNHPETAKPNDPCWANVHNQIIASNVSAAEAALQAAHATGLPAHLLTTSLEGEAREAGTMLISIVREIVEHNRPFSRPALIIAGGETTVTLRGDGLGGRNQELALSTVQALASLPNVLLATLATDGGDGPTDAAGAIVTTSTLGRAQALGLDPATALAHNAAYPFFAALDDLLRPGPTLTNVNDLTFLLISDEAA